MFPLASPTGRENTESNASSFSSSNTVRTPFEDELYRETALIYDNDYKVSLEYNTVAASTNATITSTPTTLSSYFMDNGKELLNSTSEAHRLASKQQLFNAMKEIKTLAYIVAATKYPHYKQNTITAASSVNRIISSSSAAAAASTSSSSVPHLFDPVSVAARPIPVDSTGPATNQKMNTLEDLGNSLLMIKERIHQSIQSSRVFTNNLQYLLDHHWLLLPSLHTNTLLYLSTPYLLQQYQRTVSNKNNNNEEDTTNGTTVNYPQLLAQVPHILCLPPHYFTDNLPSSSSTNVSQYYQELIKLLKKCYVPSIQCFAPLLAGDIAKRWLSSQKHKQQTNESKDDRGNITMAVAPPVGYTVSQMYMVLHQYSYHDNNSKEYKIPFSFSSSSNFQSGYCTLNINLDNFTPSSSSSLSSRNNNYYSDTHNNVLLDTCTDYTRSLMVQHSYLALTEQAKYIMEHKNNVSQDELSNSVTVSTDTMLVEDTVTNTKKRQRSTWDKEEEGSIIPSIASSWKINDIQLHSREIVIDLHTIPVSTNEDSHNTVASSKFVLIIGIGTPIDIQKLDTKYNNRLSTSSSTTTSLSTNLQRANEYLQQTIQARMMEGDGDELVRLVHYILP